jgi:hypothetical protein
MRNDWQGKKIFWIECHWFGPKKYARDAICQKIQVVGYPLSNQNETKVWKEKPGYWAGTQDRLH